MKITIYPHIATVKPDTGEGATFAALQRELSYPDIAMASGYGTILDDIGNVGPGAIPRICFLLNKWGVKYTVTDTVKEDGAPLPVDEIPFWGTLFEHQQEVTAKILQHRRGILRAPARSGKTYVIAALLAACPHLRPAVVVAPGVELLEQTVKKVRELTGEQVGQLGGGKKTAQAAIFISTPESLVRNGALCQATKLSIWDECHAGASPIYCRIRYNLRSAVRVYGVSATPWRHDDKDMILEENIGPMLATISWSQLINTINPLTGRPFLVPPILVFQRMPRLKFRPDISWQDAYQTGIVDNVVRNQCIVDYCEYMASLGMSSVATVARIDHGQKLGDQMGVPFTHGKMGLIPRRETLERLRAGRESTVVSTLYREAVDIPSLAGMYNAMGGKSSIDFYQKMRNLTDYPGKHCAPVGDCLDSALYLTRWSQRRYDFAALEPAFVSVIRNDYGGSTMPTKEAAWGWLEPYLLGDKPIRELVRA